MHLFAFGECGREGEAAQESGVPMHTIATERGGNKINGVNL